MPKLSPSVNASTSLALQRPQLQSPRQSPMRNYYDLAYNDWEDVSDDNDENYQPNESNRESSETESEVDNKKINQKECREIQKNGQEIKKKKKRIEGAEYRTQKGRDKRAHFVKDVDCHCHYSCNTKISNEEREEILRAYLKLTREELRWNFIRQHVKRIEKKRSYTTGPSRRQFTQIYNLTSNAKTHQVATLDISDKKVKTPIKKLKDTGTIETDRRGRKPPPQKKSEDVKNIIRDHIRSMPVVSSHYCRKSSKRSYLATGLSEYRLYNDFKSYSIEREVIPEKFSYYKHIFTTEFNIGFHRPKKDQCDFCIKFSNYSDDEKRNVQEEYDLHLKRKQEAREHKQLDKERKKNDNLFQVFTMDMEKVLIIYNLSSLAENNYMWHELNDPEFKCIKIRKLATRANNSDLLEVKSLYSAALSIENYKLRSLRKLCDSGTIPSTYHAF
ncbi:unnamed protein product [Psylliodes chrysocephalus]|uniref:Uncharacterized protein n=1 Tax=Psylliodes chrysocephalus TaxID=3402493 RepID=A0A9P0GFA9_9CUCU|nr:unnamed protein product [Psylliodes chrysocephala]